MRTRAAEPSWRRRLAGCAAAVGLLAASAVLGATGPASAAGSTDWPVYHHDLAGSGVDSSGVTFATPPARAWTSPPLDGQLYASPVEATNRVIAATENDTVYSLAADTGQVQWSTHLGDPVPSSQLPCGDINPTVGITGTPVIDQARGEVFVVADESIGGHPAHQLVGLDLYSGVVLLDQNVDPPAEQAAHGTSPATQLQRTALTLDDGNVVFGEGGNAGDCGQYHGYVVSVPEGGGALHDYQTTPAGTEGAIWLGGGSPIVDSSGNV